MRECHPSHSVVRSLPAWRSRTRPTRDFTPKHTLWTLFNEKIRPFLIGDKIQEADYKQVLKSLHTEAVANAIASQEPNRISGVSSPDLNSEELDLPRKTRTTLAQLRSGFSIRLNTYRQSINLVPFDLCPDCGRAPHSSLHLFDCSSHPTDLTASDLWRRPKAVVEPLVNFSSFDDLLPADPPAPPLPPEPPP